MGRSTKLRPSLSERRLVIFLGAGFSRVAGAPLASELFDEKPIVDRITRRKLVERVHARWQDWHNRTGGASEEYLAMLSRTSADAFTDAVWYVSLVIALAMGRVEPVGQTITITRHNLDRTTGVGAHEQFWTEVFRRFKNVAVVTTNYDIAPERGLRVEPHPRVPRLGFHYEEGPEALSGGGYPSYSHIQKISTRGSVPLLKLHGSVSWSARNGSIDRYHDCRPAIRGDALILPPIDGKVPSRLLQPIWERAQHALHDAEALLVIGYSLPDYDTSVSKLIRSTNARALVHVFDPNGQIAVRYQDVLGRPVAGHPGLPEGLADLSSTLDAVAAR